MTKRTTMFTSLSTVAIPVSDQDRSKALFETPGFETRLDADLGDGFRRLDGNRLDRKSTRLNSSH